MRSRARRLSEAELHVLRARLRGGILNKARRGELEMRLRIGFDYDPAGRVRLDPDARVQESLRQFFRTFRRTGSATATVKAFRAEGLSFPHRIYRGPQTGELLWTDLEHSRALWLLHHPRYTGAFCFGRTRVRKQPDGSHRHQRLLVEEFCGTTPSWADVVKVFGLSGITAVLLSEVEQEPIPSEFLSATVALIESAEAKAIIVDQFAATEQRLRLP